MSNVIDEAMRQAKEKWLEAQTLARYYRKMHFNNLVSRAEHIEERGVHVDESRHRMSKEIAEELLMEKGTGAYFYCAEKLANNTTAPRLWRDVLTWLDELTKGESK